MYNDSCNEAYTARTMFVNTCLLTWVYNSQWFAVWRETLRSDRFFLDSARSSYTIV